MARPILTLTVLAALAVPLAAPAADPTAPRTSYRTAQVTTVDVEGHRIGVDFGTGPAVLDVDPAVTLGGVASGDSVLVAVRETRPRPLVTYLHRSGTTSVGVGAFPGQPPVAEDASGSGIRRPLMLVPNPKPRGATGVALTADTAPAPPVRAANVVTEETEPASGKVSAIARVEPAPEPLPSLPSSVDALRAQSLTDLERDLSTVDVLAREADVAWNMHVGACPGAGTAGTRGWLSVVAPPEGGQDTCTASLRRIGLLAEKVRTGLRSAEDRARAGWVTPGSLRTTLERHGFDGPVR